MPTLDKACVCYAATLSQSWNIEFGMLSETTLQQYERCIIWVLVSAWFVFCGCHQNISPFDLSLKSVAFHPFQPKFGLNVAIYSHKWVHRTGLWAACWDNKITYFSTFDLGHDLEIIKNHTVCTNLLSSSVSHWPGESLIKLD